MAVVGVDFGTLASKVSFAFEHWCKSLDLCACDVQIGVARKRGIDIITNETSNRATPYVPLIMC
jgi:hypothetical protein